MADGDGQPALLTLLYVEDHPASVSVMQSLVEMRPRWRFLHAGNVAGGLEVARTEHPDLILHDMRLPDGTAEQALAALKADPATGDVPVVVLTAAPPTGGPGALLAAGAEQVWIKPHDLSQTLEFFDEIAARQG